MGKGSTRRKEDTDKIISNWDAIFGKKEKKPKLCPDCGQPNEDIIHTCSPQVKDKK